MAYVGVEVPSEISALLCPFPGARLHLTLVHLGKITKQQEYEVVLKLCKAAGTTAPFVVEATDIAVFGTPEDPRSVRLVPRTEALDTFRGKVLEALEYCGIQWSQDFAWTPHITCSDRTTALPGPKSVGFRVQKLILAGAPIIKHFEFRLRS